MRYLVPLVDTDMLASYPESSGKDDSGHLQQFFEKPNNGFLATATFRRPM
jgi:hypothetical protein